MPHLPKYQASLVKTGTLAATTADEIILTEAEAAKYQRWQLVNEGGASGSPKLHACPTAADDAQDADSGQVFLYPGESFNWTLRDSNERRLAIYNSGAVSVAYALRPTIQGD